MRNKYRSFKGFTNTIDRKGHSVRECISLPLDCSHIVLHHLVYLTSLHLISVICFYRLHGIQRDVVFYSENEEDWKVWVCTGSGHLHQSGRPEWAATLSLTGKGKPHAYWKVHKVLWTEGLQATPSLIWCTVVLHYATFWLEARSALFFPSHSLNWSS